MKDSLFDALLFLFERTVTSLSVSEKQELRNTWDETTSNITLEAAHLDALPPHCGVSYGEPRQESVRVFTPQEQFKFTKASYQYMMRVMQTNSLSTETIEHVIHRLMYSDSPFVTLHETQWMFQQVLQGNEDEKNYLFLDMLLNVKTHNFLIH